MSKSPLAIAAGNLLCSARRRAKLSAAKLIAMTDDKTLTRSLISQYEHGAVLIGYERLEKLLATCGVTPPDDIRAKYVALAAGSPNYAQVIVRTSEEIATQKLLVEFVKSWQSAASVAEVMETTGFNRAKAHYLAGLCRRNGVSLKRFHADFSTVDWESLILLATDSTIPPDAVF